MKRIMIIAGEASGDLHASHLVRQIRGKLPGSQFIGIGGTRMRDAGVKLIFENHELAVTGFSEVLTKIGKIWKAYQKVRATLRRLRPDLLILLDFPDFNLQVGKAAKKTGIPILYYISPQVWAWRQKRIGQIKGMVEKILVILPFEASLYGSKGVFVGHPLLDEIDRPGSPEEVRECFGIAEGSPIVALLPGSRRNEIAQLLPVMEKAAEKIQQKIPTVAFLLPVAPTITEEQIMAEIENTPVHITPVRGKAYDALSVSDFAMVASGTATLEAAIMGTPMVILYKVTPFTYFFAKRLVKVPHIGLINMVAGDRIVPELLQDRVTAEAIAEEGIRVLEDSSYSMAVSGKLKDGVARLGDPGASERAADVVMELIGEQG
jgi:lipid-A-disaccharide synthase